MPRVSCVVGNAVFASSQTWLSGSVQSSLSHFCFIDGSCSGYYDSKTTIIILMQYKLTLIVRPAPLAQLVCSAGIHNLGLTQKPAAELYMENDVDVYSEA